MDARVTLDQKDLKEAVRLYLASHGYEPAADSMLFSHSPGEYNTGPTYSVSVAVKPLTRPAHATHRERKDQ